jgi:hypothetical protein
MTILKKDRLLYLKTTFSNVTGFSSLALAAELGLRPDEEMFSTITTIQASVKHVGVFVEANVMYSHSLLIFGWSEFIRDWKASDYDPSKEAAGEALSTAGKKYLERFANDQENCHKFFLIFSTFLFVLVVVARDGIKPEIADYRDARIDIWRSWPRELKACEY